MEAREAKDFFVTSLLRGLSSVFLIKLLEVEQLSVVSIL